MLFVFISSCERYVTMDVLTSWVFILPALPFSIIFWLEFSGGKMALSKHQIASPLEDLCIVSALLPGSQPPKMQIVLVTFHSSFQNWDLKMQPAWLLCSYTARPINHVPSNITKNVSWPSLILCLVEIEGSFSWSLIFWDYVIPLV